MTLNVRSLTPLLQVFDMPSAASFYRDILGFEIVSTSEPGDHFDWAMLQLGDIALMLNTAYEADDRPAAPAKERIKAHADTVLFFSCASVDDTYALLRGRGLDLGEPVSTAYGMKQLYLQDRDGYGICFQQREHIAPD